MLVTPGDATFEVATHADSGRSVMEYREIEYHEQDAVAWITLNRPQRLNAWTPRMAQEQWHAIERANNETRIGSIVMTGSGRGFCAGADMSGFAGQIEAGEKDVELTTPGDWVALCRRSKPLIAAVNGPAVGVGLTMILPFDVIVASEKAKFGMFFIKLGVVPELASSHFLVQRVGFARASEMCLTGRAYAASELAHDGLFNHLVPGEDLLDFSGKLAAEIASNPDPQLRMIKELLTLNGTDSDLSRVSRREFEMLSDCYETDEHREAVKAFMEKRPPKFR
jgi:enoyl-CoA hydratase/carnithine racemase